MQQVEAFTSTTIKLAALIRQQTARRRAGGWQSVHRMQTMGWRGNCVGPLLVILVGLAQLQLGPCQASAHSDDELSHRLRHHAHYLNIVPSTHFRYNEGRQGWPAAPAPELEERSAAARPESREEQQLMYKRSSAALVSSSAPMEAHYPPLVSSTLQASPGMELLRRRMMSLGADSGARWNELATEPGDTQAPHYYQLFKSPEAPGMQRRAASRQQASQQHEEEEVAAALMRQKQHIQYHDEWPADAAKSRPDAHSPRCHKRTLNFCASVLPFNSTTFPNIIGDTNRFEVKRSLPFFGFLAKSSCNKRLDELLCLLLEPPCGPQSGAPIPPCKKFCRLALEGCNEYIPATLAMSSVFDCRQYPDSNDPNVCVNLAQGSRCAADEFKCPDKTCIPRNWLCDSVRDCIFAADEANCADTTGVGGQSASICSTEEFKCDAKCVPKAWRCDGERDCLDGLDEEACELKPRCGPDRFKCADDNGCIPKRWVCDGKAECRDGSDEMYCERQECSETDFKCNNGICIPKLWRCDRQWDCKDGSDEHGCLYNETLADVRPIVMAEKLLNSSQPATSGAPTSTPSTTVAPRAASSAAPEEQMVSNQVILEQPISYYSGLESSRQPASGSGSGGQQSRSQQSDMNRFDYDLIKSSQTPDQLHQSTQQQRPAGQHQEPQLPAGATSDTVAEQRAPYYSQTGRQAEPLTVGPPHHRVPIYRSLFKTFKSSASRMTGGGAAPHKAQQQRVRDRRVANQQTRATTSQNPTSQAVDELVKLLQWTSAPPSGQEVRQQLHLDTTGVSSSLRTPNGLQSRVDYGAGLSGPAAQAKPSHLQGVASYLQLFNPNRYHLRHPRALPQLPVTSK